MIEQPGRPPFKQPLELPREEERRPQQPALKQPLQLPQQEPQEMVSQGIQGLHDNLSVTARDLGLLSQITNLERVGVSAAKTRRGRQMLGDPLGNDHVLGLAPLYRSDGEHFLLSGEGDTWTVYYNGSWDHHTETNLYPGARFEAATFDDKLIIANGEDDVMTYDGNEFAILDADAPVSQFVETAYRRVFLVDDPHLLRVSDVALPDEWLEGDSASIPVNAKDGDEITWIRRYRQHVYVWKRYSVHEIHGPETGRVTADWSVFGAGHIGTPNGRTIAEAGRVLYWLSDSPGAIGVVAWGGGETQVISSPVKGHIERINWDAIETACAGTDGQGNYLLSVPIDGANEPNCLLVFNTRDQTWWVWEDWSVQVLSFYRIDGEETPIMGDSNGSVYRIGGDTDDGTPIAFELIFGPTTLGSSTRRKRARRAFIAATLQEDAYMEARSSNSDAGGYGQGIEFENTLPQETLRISRYMPFASGEDSASFIYRIKVEGFGNATIHDMGLEVTAAEG